MRLSSEPPVDRSALSGRVATSRLRRERKRIAQSCTTGTGDGKRGQTAIAYFSSPWRIRDGGCPRDQPRGVNWNSAHSFSPHRDRPNCLIKSSPPPSPAITLHPVPSPKNPINPWVCPPHTVCYRSLNVQRDQLTLRLSQLGSRSRCIAFEAHLPRATPPLLQ